MGVASAPEPGRLRGAAWCAAIVAAAALLRCLHPQADPPLNLGGSGGLFSDEGALANNARDLVLFGRAFTDEWNSYQYSPVLHFLQLPVFRLFGVGLLQERLVPMACGIVTVWLLFLACARAWGREAACYASFFLATSYFTIMHNRLGLIETTQTMIMVLAVVLWQRSAGGRPAFAAAAGTAVALVVITKSLGLWFVAAFFAAAGFEVLAAPAAERAGNVRRLLVAMAAAAGTMALWFALFYLPNREDLLRVGAAYKNLSLPRSPAKLLKNLGTLRSLDYYRPEWAALGAALLAVAGLLLGIGSRKVRGRSDVWRMALWLVAGAAALDALTYKPSRYFVTLFPALAALAGWGLAALRRPEPERASPAPAGLAAAWIWVTVIAAFLLPDARSAPFFQGPLRWIVAGAAAAALLGAALLSRRALARLRPRWEPAARAALVGLVLLVSLGQNWQQYRAWAVNRRFEVLRISREIAPVVDTGMLAGLFAPVLTLENSARILYAFEPWFNYERTFERFPVTHLILGDFNREPSWWWKRYPEQLSRAVPLRVYRLWHTNLFLLSLREEDRGIFNRLRKDRGGPLDSTLVESAGPRELLPGTEAGGRVTFRNSGSEPWPDGVALGVWAGRAFGPARVPLAPGTTVPPGGSVTIDLPYRAPENTGYFMMEWRLMDAAGRWFGDSSPEGLLVRNAKGQI